MFRFFKLRKCFIWSWLGSIIILSSLWIQVKIDVKINEWFGQFYDMIQKALGEPKSLKLGPQKIMMVGLYGQGKTTTTGKISKYMKKKGLSLGLIAADVHRPAAYEQLSQIGEQIQVPVFGDSKNHEHRLKINENRWKSLENH